MIIQAKDAENHSLRAIMSQNGVRLTDRIGNSDTLVVDLPLSAVNELSQSGLINYMSPDRATESTGHIEDGQRNELDAFTALGLRAHIGLHSRRCGRWGSRIRFGYLCGTKII